jgi:hypothetical protein
MPGARANSGSLQQISKLRKNEHAENRHGNRQCETGYKNGAVAKWVLFGRGRQPKYAEVELVDIAEFSLVALDEPTRPARRKPRHSEHKSVASGSVPGFPQIDSQIFLFFGKNCIDFNQATV